MNEYGLFETHRAVREFLTHRKFRSLIRCHGHSEAALLLSDPYLSLHETKGRSTMACMSCPDPLVVLRHKGL